MSFIYLDIETLDFFDDPRIAALPRWRQYAMMRPGCVVTHDTGLEVPWITWTGEEPYCSEVWNYLVSVEGAQIVTWNGDEFDLPLLACQSRIAGYNGVPEHDEFTSLDLMALIRRHTKALTGRERWYKLDDVAAATLGRRKTAGGAQTAAWLRSGDPAQIAYAVDCCRDDAQLLIDLHTHLLAGQPLVCPAREVRGERGDVLVYLDRAEYA